MKLSWTQPTLLQFYEKAGDDGGEDFAPYVVNRKAVSVEGLHYSVPLYPSWRLGLSRNCASRNILNNVTLHVPDGTLMAIMGNSGKELEVFFVIASFLFHFFLEPSCTVDELLSV